MNGTIERIIREVEAFGVGWTPNRWDGADLGSRIRLWSDDGEVELDVFEPGTLALRYRARFDGSAPFALVRAAVEAAVEEAFFPLASVGLEDRVRVVNPETGGTVGDGTLEPIGQMPDGKVAVRLDPLRPGARPIVATYPVEWICGVSRA
jgi:hypothetical protein